MKDKFNKNLDVILDEKDYILPSKKGPKLKHPIFKNINGKNIPVSFPTMKDGIKYYKNQNINVKEGINSLKPNVNEGIFYFKKTAEKENEFTWRACGKIVYEFLYLIKTNYQPSNTKFINFVLGKLNPDEFPLNIAILNDYRPLEKDMDKIYHSMIIEGRKDENIIIGYLELFDSLKVLMLIDENYKGDSFAKGHYHDLMESDNYNYFNPLVSIPLDKIAINNIVKNNPQDSDLIYCFRKSIETENKARLYPFKILAESIKDEIERDTDLKTVQIEQIEHRISNELIEWGFQINYLIIEDIIYDNMTPLQKIIIMLNFLRKSFYLLDMDTAIFKKLLSIFLFKEEMIHKYTS